MRLTLLLLALWLLTAAAPPIANGPVRVCEGPERRSCRPVSLIDLRLTGPETHIERVVTVPREALPLSRPLMVWITAMASAEVRWNGVLIGSNGSPGPDRTSERPGRFVANVAVPVELVRPGDNVVSLRLSAHHLWLPVRRTVHGFAVTRYETPTLPGLSHYLPAMLTLGALLAALIYFAASALSDRRNRSAGWVALIAGLTMLQLVIEVVRAFVAYAYPWHLVRVAAIALLAGMTAILAAAYVARRFAPGRQKTVVAVTLAAVLASLLLIPWYDLKAMGAILAAALAMIVCGGHGLRERRSGAGAGAAIVGGLMIIVLMAWQLTAFLDQAYYLIVAGLLVALVAEQVTILRLARHGRDTEANRAAGLEERLRRAAEAGEPIVELKDGARIHRVPENDILYVKAADDYCDVVLVDGRTLLVTTSLARLLETLPDRFLRVHKSYAVGRGRVAAVEPRAGGGRQLRLDDGTAIPVGRTYVAALAGRLTPSPAGG
jgi:DNA-binding LytR/AlgR family response regulator